MLNGAQTLPLDVNENCQPSSCASSSQQVSLALRGFLGQASADGTRLFHGHFSLHKLIHGLRKHLHLAYGWVYSEEDLHPKAVTLPFVQSAEADSPLVTSHTASRHNEGVFMHRQQEEECIQIFWQSYHCAIPILDEQRFRAHHQSLWTSSPEQSDNDRNSSPLVDITLAICIQYGMTHIHSETVGVLETLDPSNAGRFYFQRAQSLLKAKLESPSTTLLQCQILSVVYLRDSTLSNMAEIAAASATKTAYSLGHHLRDNESSLVDDAERELHKRLWCMVYALEGKLTMDSGRPSCIHALNIDLPRDDHDLASVSSLEMFVPHSILSITWLTYHKHHIKLIEVARQVFATVSEHRAQLNRSRHTAKSLDESDRRSCDELLSQEFAKVRGWLQNVPESLQCYRMHHARLDVSIPTDLRIDLDRPGPLWLQRQRVMLRLLYHDICVNFCRPLITFPQAFDSFPPVPSQPPPQNAEEAMSHCMAVADIVHQVLFESDILHGWHRAYQFQWNAAISMISFSFSNPSSQYVGVILTKIEKSIRVLESFGRSFAVARSATRIIRDLYDKLQLAFPDACPRGS